MRNEERGTRNEERRVYALLLAAGSSTRFGTDKLLAELDGRPLIAHVTAVLAESIEARVLAGGIAVIPPGATALARAFDAAGLTALENPDAARGLSTSLGLGLAVLSEQTPPVSGAMIVLADQPALRADVIRTLVTAWRERGTTTRPRYAAAPGEPGHPVLLDRRDWLLADRLSGDQGFRHLLTGVEVQLVDFPGANPDVDTPGDLRRLEESR